MNESWEKREEGETWGEWVARQRDDPTSPVQEMLSEGVRFETAITILMLGRIHNELYDIRGLLDE